MQRNKTKRVLLTGIIVWYIISLFTLSLSTTFGATEKRFTCLDTIAGYGSSCKASSFPMNNEVTFKITKPDTSVIRFPCTANIEGVATCDLHAFHTRQAGVYHVTAYLSGMDETSVEESIFKIYADNVSSVASQFYTSTQSVEANKKDSAYLMVIMRDKYNNPIQGHTIELISSRIEDTITKINTSVTNEEGKTYFKVTSNKAGVSTFIAKDLNTGTLLGERPKIVFYQNSPHYSTQTPSQNIYSANILSDSIGGGAVQSLEIEAPETVTANNPFDITVKALDSNGEPATSYRGIIFFSCPTDSTAKLPLQDTGYQFAGTDTDATHTFAKATMFLNKGQHKITVTDVDNPELEDSIFINVTDTGPPCEDNDNCNGTAITNITLTSPTSNGKYGESTVDITGKMKPNTAFKVFDADMEIGGDKSDSDGNLYYAAKGLNDGKHTIKVISYDASGNEQEMSDEVIFFVDTTGATLINLSFTPEKPVAGDPVEVTVVSQPKLSKVRVIVDSVAHDLPEDSKTPGTYIGKFNTPTKPGEYPIKLVLANALGKESSPATNKKIVVTGATPTEWKVPGLKTSTGQSAGTVDLSWDTPPSTITIKGYTVYYDSNPLTLGNKMNTNSSSSTFTVSNLQPGSTYYFAVAAIDEEGKENPQSDIIPGTAAKAVATGLTNIKVVSEDSKLTFTWDDPKNPSIVKYKFDYGIRSGEYLENAFTKDNKPSWYIPDLINGATYYFKLSALDQSNTAIFTSDEIIAIPGGDQYHPSACVAADVQNVQIIKRGNQRIMTWNTIPDVSIYRIYSGTMQGVFNLPTRETKDNYFVIPYLSNTVPFYYFAVKAVCGDHAQESINFSNILSVAPTGTESIVIAAISFVLVITIRYLYRKKKTA